MSKKEYKPVMRVMELPETDWHWLVGWMKELLKSIGMDELHPDVLRLGGILRVLESAQRANMDNVNGDKPSDDGANERDT